MFGDFLRLWRNRRKLSDRGLSEDLKSFLPASIEIHEKRPHPASGWLLGTVTSLTIFAVLWSVLGKVNIISIADGRVVPSGRVRQIQPYAHGMVSGILVAEGQVVEAGQPLVELDRTQAEADRTRLSAELAAVSVRARRLDALISLLRRSPGERVPEEVVLSHPALAEDARNGALLLAEYEALLFRRLALESQLRERRAEKEANESQILLHTKNMPLAKKRLDALESLFKNGQVGLTEYMSAEIYYNEQVQGRQTRVKDSERLSSAIASVENQLAAQNAQDLATALADSDDLVRQLEALGQELVKTEDLIAKQTMLSPVRGTVKELAVNTVGGIVTPAQVLMEIVPLGERLEVEAFLGNNDIGFVRAGQQAEVKVATYPFTKYGIIGAKVADVAEDATLDENHGLIYRIRIQIEKETVLVEGREMPLIPGMAVTAEISTGKRRIVEFVLAPLLRMKDESLRER
jgi:hemolysin D